MVKLHQPLGLAVCGQEINLRAGRARARVQVSQFGDQPVRIVDPRFGFRRPRLGPAAQPLNLRADAVLQRILVFLLRAQKLFFLHQKRAVVSRHAQQPARISAAQLHRFRGNVLQKISIMAHHHAGKRFRAQQLFQPLNAFKIKMVRRLVQQQHVRLLHQRFGNRQALAPPAGKRRRLRIKVFKAGAAQRFKQSSGALRFRNRAALQRFHHH